MGGKGQEGIFLISAVHKCNFCHKQKIFNLQAIMSYNWKFTSQTSGFQPFLTLWTILYISKYQWSTTLHLEQELIQLIQNKVHSWQLTFFIFFFFTYHNHELKKKQLSINSIHKCSESSHDHSYLIRRTNELKLNQLYEFKIQNCLGWEHTEGEKIFPCILKRSLLNRELLLTLKISTRIHWNVLFCCVLYSSV